MSNFKVVINSKDEVVAYGPDEESYEPGVPENCKLICIEEEELQILLAPIPKTKAQVKVEELSALLVQYKAEMKRLQDTWVSVSFTDGSTEGDKKAVIQADAVEVKAKYIADKVAINQKYL